MSTNGTQPSDVVAVLHKCPECDGHGDLPPHGECGVCLGDQVMVAQDSHAWSDMLDRRVTDDGTRFVDHTLRGHICSRCDGPGNIHDDESESEDARGQGMSTTKIYLAARYSRHPEMQGVRDVLEGGFGTGEVTSRWIEGDHQLVDHEQEADGVQFAIEDIEDLRASDIVIAFTEEPRTTKTRGGRHVELGYALALGKRVIVVGPRENVFCYLPEIEWFPDWSRAAYHFASSVVA